MIALIKKYLPFAGLAFIAFFYGFAANAQEKTLQLADKAFARGEFYTAAKYYEKYLSDTATVAKKELNPYNNRLIKQRNASVAESVRKAVTLKLAESYRLHNDYGVAEKYYDKVLNNHKNSSGLNRLNYGICLRANGKLDEAQKQLNQFIQENKSNAEYVQKAKTELANISFYISQLSNPAKRVTVEKIAATAKLPNASYAPAAVGNSIYFTGTTFDSSAFKKGSNPFRNVLYQLNNNLGSIDSLNLGVSGITHKAAIAFTPDGKTAFFTAWALNDSGVKTSAIYTSKKEINGWATPSLVPNVNIAGFASQQPNVSTDGKYLYFSSNRNGGVGGFDIWYSTLDANGVPGEALNAGSINTVQDEQAPYFHSKSNTLYFATNGRLGFGGFDLFQAKGSLNTWETPVNLGYPVNSVKDDIYFSSNSVYHAQKEAYFSSDRASDCCLELFKLNTAQGKRFLKGVVLDCETNQPLPASMIILHQGSTKTGDTIFTQDNGKYQFPIKEGVQYQLNVSKPNNYPAVNITIPANITDSVFADTVAYPDVCLTKNKLVDTLPNKEVVDVLKGKPLGINFEFDKSDLLPKSIIALDFFASVLNYQPEIKMEIGGHTDSYGNDEYNRKLGERRSKACFDYLVKKGIDSKRLVIVSYGKCCPLVPETVDGKDNPEARFKNRRVECKLLN